MRLSKIKLVGFKSFVDATTLSFPSNLVGVVGPNGCGKSNVIDAVRWVMGESSAKHLRGSAMLDVIFNGSTTRKPAELAAIELHFSEVNVTQYPPDSEIAIKRQLTRDGQSTYFINNIRCRRKDITDLFLGTGLGPRSYAIIEQGMISRLIEAKPEELRVFLEEAAGISKYKERRKETEQRMQQTRENLGRLDEIRHELDKQIEKLQKQAKQAEKFQELKKTEHLLRAQLHAIRWYELDMSIQELQQPFDEQVAVLEKYLLSLQHLEETYQQQHHARIQAQMALDDKQGQFYTVEGEINRLEQTVEHIQEKIEQLQLDSEQLTNTWQETKQQLEQDEFQLEQIEQELQTTENERNNLQAENKQAIDSLQNAEYQLEAWRSTWDEFNERATTPMQQAQIAKTQLQHLETRLAQNQQRLFRLQEERRSLDPQFAEQAVQQVAAELNVVQAELTDAEVLLTTHHSQVLRLRDDVQAKSARLHEQQSHTHQLSGRLAALEALQEAALGKNSTDLNAWLHAHRLQHNQHLAQLLTVEKKWQAAVEMVLDTMLQALCVDDLTVFQTGLQRPPQGELILFETIHVKSNRSEISAKNATLQEKITIPYQLESLFAGIYITDTLEQAYGLRTQLAAHESVITPQCIWLGAHWLRSQQGDNEKTGIIEREQEINKIAKQLGGYDEEIIKLTNELERQRLALREHELQREHIQQQVDLLRQQSAELQTQYSNRILRLEHLTAQIQRVDEECSELTQQISEDDQSLEETRHHLHTALAEMEQLADEREELTKQRELYQETVEQAREITQESQRLFHQVEVKLESLHTDMKRLQQGGLRLNSRLEQLSEKRYEIQQNLDKQAEPLENLQQELIYYTEQRIEIGETLRQAKQTLTHLEANLSQYNEERHQLEAQSQALRAKLEQARMTIREKEVRKQTIEEQLAVLDLSPVALLAELPGHADEISWLAQIEAAERKIERIGSVNLAALQEFTEQAERKRYLDEQAEDLNKSLVLLENAIKTIDRETRLRFNDTLETVNNNLQDTFPRLFGGGQASLELVGEDVLKAGVAIIARPPGKRNSTIHLLSGGEKALTAIALVFSIFQLNPAPFCLLDEVDAPLDDSNVGRFSSLVQTMADRVQFIFISHNKLAMEMANQLIGITMQEAGVSRPVSVDVDTAISMIVM